MRIKVGEKIYIQNYDLEFIFNEVEIYPEEIRQKVRRSTQDSNFPGKKNGFQFDYYFEEQETLGWLENQSWLVNYEEFSEKDSDEIKKACKKVKRTSKKMAEKFINHEQYFDKREIEFFSSMMRIEKHIIFSLEILRRNRKARLFDVPKSTQS